MPQRTCLAGTTAFPGAFVAHLAVKGGEKIEKEDSRKQFWRNVHRNPAATHQDGVHEIT